jgi:hypothetical protein
MGTAYGKGDSYFSLDQKDRWRDLIARRNSRLGLGLHG